MDTRLYLVKCATIIINFARIFASSAYTMVSSCMFENKKEFQRFQIFYLLTTFDHCPTTVCKIVCMHNEQTNTNDTSETREYCKEQLNFIKNLNFVRLKGSTSFSISVKIKECSRDKQINVNIPFKNIKTNNIPPLKRFLCHQKVVWKNLPEGFCRFVWSSLETTSAFLKQALSELSVYISTCATKSHQFSSHTNIHNTPTLTHTHTPPLLPSPLSL